MMIALIQIVVGLFIWKIMPHWIQSGTRKNKQKIRFYLNIIGAIIVLIGIISIIRILFNPDF